MGDPIPGLGVVGVDAPQEQVARLALAAASSHGFVLAGGNAIALHGIGHRPTEDVDLFTNHADPGNFKAAVDAVISALEADGWETEANLGWQTYARITATRKGVVVSVDLGLDYRSSPPTVMEIGPVLALKDAAGSKMATLYSRGLPRDFLDVYALVTSGRFTIAELMALADTIEANPMDRRMLTDRLRAIAHITDPEFSDYGLDAADIATIREQFATWAGELRDIDDQVAAQG